MDVQRRADPGRVFDDAAAIAGLDRRADADIAAGRLLDHDAVMHWLDSWGLDSRGLDSWGLDSWGLDSWGPDRPVRPMS